MYFIIQILFKIYILLILLLSVFLFLFKNPIHSVLNLILIFVLSLLILLLLKVEFLTYVYVMIYVGAIALLFLFIIMMLNLKEQEYNNNILNYSSLEDKSLYILMISKFFCLIFFFCNYLFKSLPLEHFKSSYWLEKVDYSFYNDIYIFYNLYSEFWLHFIVIGFILLLALIGAINLTTSNFDINYNLNNIDPTIPILFNDVLFFSFSLSFIGLLGIVFNKNNLLILLIFCELLFFSLSFNFIVVSVFFLIPSGQIYSLFLTSLAACESVIGLSFLIIFFRLNGNLLLDSIIKLRC